MARITRRDLIKTAGGGIAASAAFGRFGAPAVAQSSRARTLRLIPINNISVLDATWSAQGVAIDHAHTIFDMLYGLDDQYQARPQMAEGHTISDDGRTWLIKLRDGLRFHDGTPVLAADCAASIRRWTLKDTFGQLVRAATDTMDAPDDKTIRVRLKYPFPKLDYALADLNSFICPMMPARIAAADDNKPITEMIGSGPYRFLKDEFAPGSRVAYARNEAYVPRSEAANRMAGGKIAHFDRVEWTIITDAGTAAAALQAGEVDWWQYPAPDLLPILRADEKLKIDLAYEAVSVIRFNCLVPPFDNPKLRKAVLEAVNQDEYMTALVGAEKDAYRTCYSMFGCGDPRIPEVGAAQMRGPKNLDAARAAIKASGYNGEKIVVLSAMDAQSVQSSGHVTIDLFRKLGLNAELRESDWSSMFARALNKEPVERGGWSVFHSWKHAVTMNDPASNQFVRGLGTDGYQGWYDNKEVESLFMNWVGAAGPAESLAAIDKMQHILFNEPPIVPLGQWKIYTAYARNLTGMVRNATVPWNLRRA